MWYCKYKEQHNIFVQIGHGQNNVHKCVSVHKWKSVNSVRLVLRSVIFFKEEENSSANSQFKDDMRNQLLAKISSSESQIAAE